MRKTEINVTIEDSIKFSNDSGGFDETSSITLKAPSMRNGAYTSDLKQYFMTAVTSLPKGDEKPTDDNAEIDAKSIVAIFLMSGKTPYSKVMTVFLDMVIKGRLALLDGQVPMTSVHIDLLHPDDCDALLGEYLSNFLISSLTK